jgi:hypothetical protein
VTVDALRTQAQAFMFATIGVPITIARPEPDSAPIATTGIWMVQPPEEHRPFGTDFQRREPRRLMAIRRIPGLETFPRGTVITAPELQGGTATDWRVDGFSKPVETDEYRVHLVPTDVTL